MTGQTGAWRVAAETGQMNPRFPFLSETNPDVVNADLKLIAGVSIVSLEHYGKFGWLGLGAGLSRQRAMEQGISDRVGKAD